MGVWLQQGEAHSTSGLPFLKLQKMKTFAYIFLSLIPFIIYGIGTGHYWHIATLIIVLLCAMLLFLEGEKKVNKN